MSFLQQNNMNSTKHIVTFILTKLTNHLNRIVMLRKNYSMPQVHGYTFVKLIKVQDASIYPSVGIYKDKQGKKVVIKSLEYVFKNSAYFQLRNECDILIKIRNSFKGTLITSPRVLGLTDMNHRLLLITEYINPVDLYTLSSKKQESIVKEVIKQTSTLPNRSLNIPVMSKEIIFFSFPIYLLIQLIKDYKNYKMYLSLFSVFYKHYSIKQKVSYTFNHRDLHLNNILYDGKKIYIIDPEVGAYGNKETDLVIFLRNSFKDNLTFRDSITEYYLESKYDFSIFIALNIYYSIQMMAIRQNCDDDYKNARSYFLDFNDKYLKNISENYSLAEIFHKAVLVLLSKMEPINKRLLNIFRNYVLIICYHSISSDGWRFSMSPEEFEEQMKLASKRNPVPLSSIFSKNKIKSGTVITFDDGYEDFLTTALPILKKYKIPATMFVLGNPEKANHSELQNTKKMLSISQIKSLHKQGVEIGFHTATHSDMRKMNDAELEYEIKTSKENLEKKLGFKLRYFAYPRGIYDKRIIEKVKDAGFEKAFTVNGGIVRESSADMLLNRISIEGSVNFKQFVAMISPLGILFETIYMGTLKIKEQVSFMLKERKRIHYAS